MTDTPKRGRPPKSVVKRRRHNQTFRCNDEMLSRLRVEAERNQRSISEEVEARILDSFGPNEVMKAAIRHVLSERDASLHTDIRIDASKIARAVAYASDHNRIRSWAMPKVDLVQAEN